MRSAAGPLPSPGMVMISPANATTKPAPAEGRMSRTCSVKPVGAPSLVASSEKAQRELGWRPHYTELRPIIETAWNWQRKHPRGYGDRR